MAESLKPLCGKWTALLEVAYAHKKAEFQDDADECYRFFDGPYDFLYKPRGANSGGFDVDDFELRSPSVRMTVNKAAELVDLFGPAIYHRNPVRLVNPRKIIETPAWLFGDVQNDPMAAMMMQQTLAQQQSQMDQDDLRSKILEKYLNYTPDALDLKSHSRWAMTEALIKGLGVLWTQPYRPPGSTKTWVGSFYDCVDNLYLDPDATNIRDIKWLARRRCEPVWEVERKFGYAPGILKPSNQMESMTSTAMVMSEPNQDYRRKQGRTADLLIYWEIYSKMGLGGRLQGLAQNLRDKYDVLGDHVYLAITDTMPYPLNLPPPLCDVLGGDDPMALQQYLPQIQQRCQWETPFWTDNGWPCSFFAFHWRPGKLWPMSHLKPGLGELKFINWAMSFLSGKIRIASRDFIAIAKAAGEELREKIKHGSDYTIIEMENVLGSIDQVVKFLQHPGFNPEIYNVIAQISNQFDKRVGLTELIYGQSARQMRSAQEAQIKSDAINVRPDDMANSAEDTMTEISRKEAFAARWHLRGQDVVDVLGPTGAQLWEQMLVMQDPALVIHNLEYRIQASSARKPNKAAKAEDMSQAMQTLFQPLWGYATSTGDVNPVNALISDWADSIDTDATKYLLNPPPPPPPPPPPTDQVPPQTPPPA